MTGKRRGGVRLSPFPRGTVPLSAGRLRNFGKPLRYKAVPENDRRAG